jgi:hypothetical protein
VEVYSGKQIPWFLALLRASQDGSVAKKCKLIKMMTAMKAERDSIKEKEYSFYMLYQQNILKYLSF